LEKLIRVTTPRIIVLFVVRSILVKMNQKKIKQSMDEIKKKMMLIEWDRKKNYPLLKSGIYEELKKEYEKLEKELKNNKKIQE